jgi:hypothetical protein
MNPQEKKYKKPTSLMKGIILATFLAASVQAQVFNSWQPVASRSDRDFKVAWSNAGPAIEVNVLNNGRVVKETRAYYMTTVRGKGKLTKLQENSNSSVLLTVEGLQDHAVWLVLMNPTSSRSDGAKFWHVGDIISVDAGTTLINDDRIPRVHNSEGLTTNTSRHPCDERGCWDGHKWQK